MKYFLLIPLVIAIASFFYVIMSGYRTLYEFPVARNVYLITTILLFFFMIVGTFVKRLSSVLVPKAIAFIGNTSLIILFYLMILFFLIDMVRLINHFIPFVPEGMNFRLYLFLTGLAVITITLIIGNYKFRHPSIVNLEIETKGKPKQNETLKIVAVSDIHLGISIDKEKLQKYVEMINAQNADIVLFVGDTYDNDIEAVTGQNMHEELLKIKAPSGVYGILGNHEYIRRNVQEKIAYLEKGNIRILRDSTILIDNRFYIVGRDDRSNPKRKTIEKLLSETDKSKPIILLDHQPFHLEEAEENRVDLQISGHTHDGQFFPVNLVVKMIYANPYGYSVQGNTHYYVSSGLGIWGPQYRIGTQSEIAIINMKF